MNLYFKGTISKTELGFWAKSEYNEILKGEYLLIRKLKIYPFIKVVSKVDIVANDIKDEYPCSDKELIEIYEIITGKKDFECIVDVSISPALFERHFSKFDYIGLKGLRDCLNLYLEKGKLYDDESIPIRNFLSSRPKSSNETLISVLISTIYRMLKHYVFIENNTIYLKKNYGLYANRKTLDQNEAVFDLIKLLDYVTGEKLFKVHIVYVNGNDFLYIV